MKDTSFDRLIDEHLVYCHSRQLRQKTLHSINKDEIRKVLSKPWTVDRQTFSDRIWSNKQSLINTVNTELTQMIMRGAAPDNAIKAISERFKVSKSQAGRLVMTESAALPSAALQACAAAWGSPRAKYAKSTWASSAVWSTASNGRTARSTQTSCNSSDKY